MKSHVSCFESMGYEQVRQAWKKIFDHRTSDSIMNPTAQKGKKIKASKNKTKKKEQVHKRSDSTNKQVIVMFIPIQMVF